MQTMIENGFEAGHGTIDAGEGLPVLISAKDAEKIGLTTSAFYRLMHREDFPTVVIGGRRYIRRDRFFAWLDSHTGGC